MRLFLVRPKSSVTRCGVGEGTPPSDRFSMGGLGDIDKKILFCTVTCK